MVEYSREIFCNLAYSFWIKAVIYPGVKYHHGRPVMAWQWSVMAWRYEDICSDGMMMWRIWWILEAILRYWGDWILAEDEGLTWLILTPPLTDQRVVRHRNQKLSSFTSSFSHPPHHHSLMLRVIFTGLHAGVDLYNAMTRESQLQNRAASCGHKNPSGPDWCGAHIYYYRDI